MAKSTTRCQCGRAMNRTPCSKGPLSQGSPIHSHKSHPRGSRPLSRRPRGLGGLCGQVSALLAMKAALPGPPAQRGSQ